jgi:hypothetical protein
MTVSSSPHFARTVLALAFLMLTVAERATAATTAERLVDQALQFHRIVFDTAGSVAGPSAVHPPRRQGAQESLDGPVTT